MRVILVEVSRQRRGIEEIAYNVILACPRALTSTAQELGATFSLPRLPDGQIKTSFVHIRVYPHFEKYSASVAAKINLITPPSRPAEGRIMIVTVAGRDARVALDERGPSGRRSRVDLAPGCHPRASRR